MDEFESMNLFGFPLPPGMGEKLMKGLILSSKVGRTLYEEHINNGFTEEQAMSLLLSFQSDVIDGISYVFSSFASGTQSKGD